MIKCIKNYIKNNKQSIRIYCAVGLLIGAIYLTVGCPIRYLTGICCPGCGMTRALLACLRFDFKEAFHMHPLIFIMPPTAIIYILRKKLPRWLLNILTALFFILLLAVYVYRICSGSDVVYFSPEGGLIGKIIFLISGGI